MPSGVSRPSRRPNLFTKLSTAAGWCEIFRYAVNKSTALGSTLIAKPSRRRVAFMVTPRQWAMCAQGDRAPSFCPMHRWYVHHSVGTSTRGSGAWRDLHRLGRRTNELRLPRDLEENGAEPLLLRVAMAAL